MSKLSQVTTQQEESMFLATIAKNVKNIRISKSITQLEASLGIGIASQGSYANMENCASNKRFNLIHLLKLSKFFGVDIKDFFVLPKPSKPNSTPDDTEINLEKNKTENKNIIITLNINLNTNEQQEKKW